MTLPFFFSGGFGVDFAHNTENVEAGIERVARGILAHGVTSFCPTLVTSTPEVYRKVCIIIILICSFPIKS